MSTVTITFGDRAENNVGMEILGNCAERGLNRKDLLSAREKFRLAGIKCSVLRLECPGEGEDAHILIARNALSLFVPLNELQQELFSLDWDKKALMRGRVVNKHARHNLIFSNFSQEPDYESGKGRVVNLKDCLNLKLVKEGISSYFGDIANNLTAEGNMYYDVSKCGIGFHGDAERKITIGARIGERMSFVIAWYKNSERVEEPRVFYLNSGDIYAMSEKATGYDWLKRSIFTLRHSAGCEKFTGVSE